MVELGSFDAAAERLHVTPSAISQRIKAWSGKSAKCSWPVKNPAGQRLETSTDVASVLAFLGSNAARQPDPG